MIKFVHLKTIFKNYIMTWTDFFNGTAHAFQWGFKYMKCLGNIPNVIFWLIIVVLMMVWLSMQGKYNKEAEEKGTLK